MQWSKQGTPYVLTVGETLVVRANLRDVVGNSAVALPATLTARLERRPSSGGDEPGGTDSHGVTTAVEPSAQQRPDGMTSMDVLRYEGTIKGLYRMRVWLHELELPDSPVLLQYRAAEPCIKCDLHRTRTRTLPLCLLLQYRAAKLCIKCDLLLWPRHHLTITSPSPHHHLAIRPQVFARAPP